MNRLIIIGNGFDLAHGLPSRYEDFILSLINKAIEDLNKQDESTVILNQLFSLKKNKSLNTKIEKYQKLVDFKVDSKINRYHNFCFFKDNFTPNERPFFDEFFSFTINSKLFDFLFSKQNWTDIEKGYFDILSTIYKTQNDFTPDSDDLKKLNSDFEYLKSLFIDYVKDINVKVTFINDQLKYQIEKCFYDPDLYEFYKTNGRKEILKQRFENSELEKLIFVNFNYTNVLEKYLQYKSFQKKIIPIHGIIENPKDLVFGYGDEMTEYYKKLENLDDENVLKHFKSHYYHSTDNYSDLLFEVENEEYDVVVFGHSLGLSDRLLLNTIFENKNCKAIHLFHSGGESHFKKRIALSRHFDDKKAFRKKLMEEIEYLKVDRE
jgi:hypothetical protein